MHTTKGRSLQDFLNVTQCTAALRRNKRLTTRDNKRGFKKLHLNCSSTAIRCVMPFCLISLWKLIWALNSEQFSGNWKYFFLRCYRTAYLWIETSENLTQRQVNRSMKMCWVISQFTFLSSISLNAFLNFLCLSLPLPVSSTSVADVGWWVVLLELTELICRRWMAFLFFFTRIGKVGDKK